MTNEQGAQKLTPVLCNEDGAGYNALLKELTDAYRPLNQITVSIVQDIATARWQVERLDRCIAIQWNLALADSPNDSSSVARELAVAHRINRQIDQLQLRIARLERRIKFVHANFPAVATQPAVPAETKTQINEPAVDGEQQLPRCKIFVMPSPMPSPMPLTSKTAGHPLAEEWHKRTPA